MDVVYIHFRDHVEQTKTVQEIPAPTATEEGASREIPTTGTQTVLEAIQSARQRSLEVFPTLLPEVFKQKLEVSNKCRCNNLYITSIIENSKMNKIHHTIY